MTRKLLNIFIFLVFCAFIKAEYTSYKDYKVYKIVPENDDEVNVLKNLHEQGYFFWNDEISINSDVKIMVGLDKQDEFEKHIKSVGMVTEIIINDVQKLIDNQMKRPKLNRINSDYDWDYYQSLDEIYEWLDKIAETYPDIVTPVIIGTTIEGRPIRGVKIDYKKQENPVIGMFEGGIHSREWISPATVTWIIKEFLMSEDPDVRFMAENIVWHLFPVVNPDGYVYSFTNNRMWRKNRNPVSSKQCNNDDDLSNGIDLNRNFDYLWMTVGASLDSCTETYAGPVANSEIETRAIIAYVESLKQQGDFVFYYAFHSAAQMILVPYSHVSGQEVLEVPNYGDLFEIATRGNYKLYQKHGTIYQVGTSKEILYAVSGSSFDWVKGGAEIPVVFLFELRGRGGNYGFLLPPEQIKDNNEEIMAALVEMDRVSRELGYYRSSHAFLFKNDLLLVFVLAILGMYLF